MVLTRTPGVSFAALEALLAELLMAARGLVRHDLAPVEGALERLEALVETSACAVVFTSPHERILSANRAARRLTGYSRLELLQMAMLDLTAPEAKSTFQPLWRDLVGQNRQQGRYVLHHRLGEWIHAEHLSVANVLPGVNVRLFRRNEAAPTDTAARQPRRKSRDSHQLTGSRGRA